MVMKDAEIANLQNKKKEKNEIEKNPPGKRKY